MDTSQALVAAARSAPPRRYRTNAEKRRIVEEALSGEVSVAEVARRHGVNANQLFNWRKLYREGRLDQCREPASATLVPVRVAPPSNAVLPGVSSSHIEIELPGDIRVRVHGRVDGQALAEVLVALGQR
jgi:transposase